jgi:hypothetical protein
MRAARGSALRSDASRPPSAHVGLAHVEKAAKRVDLISRGSS